MHAVGPTARAFLSDKICKRFVATHLVHVSVVAGTNTLGHMCAGQWVFLDWLPVRRVDSPHDIRERPAVHRAVEGPTIVGTYNPHMPTSNGRVERLDPCMYPIPLQLVETNPAKLTASEMVASSGLARYSSSRACATQLLLTIL